MGALAGTDLTDRHDDDRSEDERSVDDRWDDEDRAAEAERRWWSAQARRCPRCGGPGRPVVLEVTDASTQLALREGLACLGDCCIDGTGAGHVCSRCGHEF